MTFATQANMKLVVFKVRIKCFACLPVCAIGNDDVDGAKTNFRRPNGNTRRPNFIYDIFVIFILDARPAKMSRAGRGLSEPTTMISKCGTHRSEKETEAWPQKE